MKNGAYPPKSDSVNFSPPIWSVFCLQIVSNTSTIYKEGIMYASLSPCKVGRVGLTCEEGVS